jgi:hypothetical protein
MSDIQIFWLVFEESLYIGYGSMLIWALAIGIAEAILISVVVVLGRILNRYIKRP